MDRSAGFIGAGRVARILLGGLKRSNNLPAKIVASDINTEPLEKLKALVPEASTIVNGNKDAASCDIVFLALHPPAIPSAADEIKSALRENAVLISLAPKVTISRLREMLGGFDRLARMIPNACSIVNSGYNPICFSSAIAQDERYEILD